MRIILLVVGIGAGVGILWFAYYALSPLFINLRVDEALPQSMQPQTHTEYEKLESASAIVVGTAGHPASGTARLVETDGKVYVRYENFKTINGPDIYVYLAKDLKAKEFIDLGEVRATEGNVNYEVPEGVSISEYRYVLTWCKQFGVLFNYADLTSGDAGFPSASN